MPAIAPSYLNCTVYLYPSKETALQGIETGGSGFIVAVRSRHPDRLYPYVVTNRHVINGGNHVIRINMKDGRSEAVMTEPEDWIVAVDDDLAVLEFNIPEGAEWTSFSPDIFLGEDCAIEGWPIYPGDNAFFYGRLITHDGKQRNKPVMRFGNISMLPDSQAPIRVGDHEQVAFLVECRSLSGFSGSPAFVNLAQPRLMSADGSDDKTGWIPSTIRFLGVDCAHLPFWSPVRDRKDRNTFVSDMWVETNSGIAVIIPAWRLASLLNEKRLVKERERFEHMLDEQLGTSHS